MLFAASKSLSLTEPLNSFNLEKVIFFLKYFFLRKKFVFLQKINEDDDSSPP